MGKISQALGFKSFQILKSGFGGPAAGYEAGVLYIDNFELPKFAEAIREIARDPEQYTISSGLTGIAHEFFHSLGFLGRKEGERSAELVALEEGVTELLARHHAIDLAKKINPSVTFEIPTSASQAYSSEVKKIESMLKDSGMSMSQLYDAYISSPDLKSAILNPVAKTANQVISNHFVTMTANMQRLSESEAIVARGILKQLEEELVVNLRDNPTLTDYSRRRFEALVNQNRATIGESYKTLTADHQTFLENVAGLSASNTANGFRGLGIPLDTVALTTEQLKSLATNSLIEGAPSRAWWAKQQLNLQESFTQQIRMGYAGGETVDQMVQRIRGTATGVKHPYLINGQTKWYHEFEGGIMDTGTRQAEALVRTSVQQISSDAKMMMFQQNRDILKGVQWVATLDGRTTLLCASRDSLLWDLDGNPIGHNLPFLGGPPAHWGCRSTLVPVVKSFEEMGATPGIDQEYLDTLEPGTRASLQGEVPETTTFDDWFQTLTEDKQRAYLGQTKFDIWQEKGLTMAQMANQFGNPLTITQLAAEYGYVLPGTTLPSLSLPPASLTAIEVDAKIQEVSRVMNFMATETVAEGVLAEGKVSLISKTYDLSNVAEFSAFKKHRNELLGDYRRAVRGGKNPSQGALAAFETMTQQEKTDFLMKLSLSPKIEQAATAQAKGLVAKPAAEIANVLTAQSRSSMLTIPQEQILTKRFSSLEEVSEVYSKEKGWTKKVANSLRTRPDNFHKDTVLEIVNALESLRPQYDDLFAKYLTGLEFNLSQNHVYASVKMGQAGNITLGRSLAGNLQALETGWLRGSVNGFHALSVNGSGVGDIIRHEVGHIFHGYLQKPGWGTLEYLAPQSTLGSTRSLLDKFVTEVHRTVRSNIDFEAFNASAGAWQDFFKKGYHISGYSLSNEKELWAEFFSLRAAGGMKEGPSVVYQVLDEFVTYLDGLPTYAKGAAGPEATAIDAAFKAKRKELVDRLKRALPK